MAQLKAKYAKRTRRHRSRGFRARRPVLTRKGISQHGGLVRRVFHRVAWGSRREPERRAELALESLASQLKIEWSLPPRAERNYSPTDSYQIGDAIVHPRFGRGRVVGKPSDTSIEIAFSAGLRKLVCRAT